MPDPKNAADELKMVFRHGYSPSGRLIPSDVCAVFERPEALASAGIEIADESAETGDSAPGTYWSDLVGNVVGDLGFAIRSLSQGQGVRRDVFRLGGELCQLFDPALKRMGLFIMSDMTEMYCQIAIMHRALKRGPGELGETLIGIMAAGAIPCGIEGEWPGGKVLAYWPHPEKPPIAAAV